MAKPLPSQTLLTLAITALLVGCVAKPPERHIVLRPPISERRQARRTVPSPQHSPHVRGGNETASDAASPTPSASPLTSEQRETLFREFDEYLTHSGQPQ